jgi:hypothetical protein
MTSTDRIAVFLCLAVVIGAALVSGLVFENMAHLEDEFAYLWQGQVIAGGDLTLPSPEFSSSFLVPFVIDYQGARFAKYPLGWPVVLSLGIRVGLRDWVNPILAGLAVWLVYRLGKRTFGETVGILAAALLGSSPFFLIQAGTLLSHVWSLVLCTAFTLFWIDALETEEKQGRWFKSAAAGLCLGALGLTRPLTMAAIALPFGIHGILLLIRGSSRDRRQVILIGGITLCLLSLHFIWQWALTGRFLTNPYTLWWTYDKIGFGPGYGVTEGGHSLLQGWWNTKQSLRTGLSDLFGWWKISWILLPFGLIKARKSRITYLFIGIFLSLVSLYAAYWIGSRLFGPRYYFEALAGLTILTALGISWIAGWTTEPGNSRRYQDRWDRVRSVFIICCTSLLIIGNLYFYLPDRMQGLRGLYGIERSDLAIFTSSGAKELTPALVIVHSEFWMSYGSLLELESPTLDSPFIFAWSIGPQTDQALVEKYTGTRRIFHYYPEQEPGKLYTFPAPGYLTE